MMNALKVNDDLRVIILFDVKDGIGQLTSRGLHGVEVTSCFIYNADNMSLLATGLAIKQPDDLPDANKGRKLALMRAMSELTLMLGLQPSDRRKVWLAFRGGEQQQDMADVQAFSAWLSGLYPEDPVRSVPIYEQVLDAYDAKYGWGWGV